MPDITVGLVVIAEAEVTPGPNSDEEERRREEERFKAEGPTREEEQQ